MSSNSPARRRTSGKKESFDLLLKLLLLGDSGVGKSSLLTQYVEDEFHDVFISTIGIDFRNKSLTVDGTKVKLRIWDTAGQERFRTLTAQFYRGSQGILMLYDMTNETTFNNIHGWMKQIKNNTKGTDPCIVLVANKLDLAQSKRMVSRAQGMALAKKYGIRYFETSALTKSGVNDAFLALAQEVVRRHTTNKEKQLTDSLKQGNKKLSDSNWHAASGNQSANSTSGSGVDIGGSGQEKSNCAC